MKFCELGTIRDGVRAFMGSFEGEAMKQLALACILLCAALATAQSPKWTDREAWRVKLQLYMTMQQVHFLLGDPVGREVSKIAQIWYYKKGPVRDGGYLSRFGQARSCTGMPPTLRSVMSPTPTSCCIMNIARGGRFDIACGGDFAEMSIRACGTSG